MTKIIIIEKIFCGIGTKWGTIFGKLAVWAALNNSWKAIKYLIFFLFFIYLFFCHRHCKNKLKGKEYDPSTNIPPTSEVCKDMTTQSVRLSTLSHDSTLGETVIVKFETDYKHAS